MFGALSKLLQGLFLTAGGKILTGLGLGLASGMIAMSVINFYVAKITAQAGFLGDMAAILHIGGMDKAISIIIGGCVVRVSLMATKVSLIKKK